MHVPEEHQKSILMRLSCGALAGLFGQTLTYPLDVVKRQMQVGSLQNGADGDAAYKNTFDGLRKIVRNQGWRQLFAGVSINYIRVMLTLSYNLILLLALFITFHVSSFSLKEIHWKCKPALYMCLIRIYHSDMSVQSCNEILKLML